MKIPRLTAEAGIGPALHTYAAPVPATAGTGDITPMGFFDDLTGALGNIFGGITDKIPCLVQCGLPNALSLIPECGLDPACWIEQAGSAAAGCISQCLT